MTYNLKCSQKAHSKNINCHGIPASACVQSILLCYETNIHETNSRFYSDKYISSLFGPCRLKEYDDRQAVIMDDLEAFMPQNRNAGGLPVMHLRGEIDLVNERLDMQAEALMDLVRSSKVNRDKFERLIVDRNVS